MPLSNSVRGSDFDSEVVLSLSFPKDERLGVQLRSGGAAVAPWPAACQAALSSTISQGLLKFMPIELTMLSNSRYTLTKILVMFLYRIYTITNAVSENNVKKDKHINKKY